VIIVEATTYHATLHSPLFYSSSEGVLISADRILGSTALTYSLAYTLGLLKKHYFLFGEEAINHQYQELMGSNSPALINKVRRYIGLAPGSTFEFTVWSKDPLPDDLFLTVGIRRSGELRLRKAKLADKVHLNLYMLKEVYGIGEQLTEDEQITLFDIYNASGKFVRGSDYRKQHFLDVDFKFTNDEIIPLIFR